MAQKVMIDQGNLMMCLKTHVLSKLTIDQGNLMSVRTVKEEHAPEEYREIASPNTNNEFNREIKEEDIDFNIPGLPHATVKQLHGASVRELIQKIENHPHRQALQHDLQSQQFNPFSEESKELIHEVGWEHRIV